MQRLIIFIIIISSLIIVPLVGAQGGSQNQADALKLTPINIGDPPLGAQILAPEPGMFPNLGLLGIGGDCSNAATSFVIPGKPAQADFVGLPGVFTSNASLDEATVQWYMANLAWSIYPEIRTLGSQPNAMDGAQLPDDVKVMITDDYACRAIAGGTGMFWRVETEGYGNGWILESIRWEPYTFDMSVFAPEFEANELQQQNPIPAPLDKKANDTEITMHAMSLHFLKPYIVLTPADMAANDLFANVPGNVIPCELGDPTDLAIGDTAWRFASGYRQMRDYTDEIEALANNEVDLPDHDEWEFYPDHFELDELGAKRLQVFSADIPVSHTLPTDDPFANALVPADEMGIVTMTLIDGPACNTGTGGIQDVLNTYFYGTWWKVELDHNGQTMQGWYPDHIVAYNDYDPYIYFNADSAWGHWNENAFPKFTDFDDRQVYDFLIKTEANAAMLTGTIGDLPLDSPKPEETQTREHILLARQVGVPSAADDCEGLMPGRVPAGEHMHPFADLNIRDTANGNVIGQAAATRTFIATGNSDCGGGFRWLEATDLQGELVGWMAESDLGGYYLVPGWAPRPTEAAPPPPTTPEQPPTNNNDGGSAPPPPVVTEVPPASTPIPAEPTVPPRPTEDPCDPATGAGCG